jgi:hypothetical protein
VPAPELPDVVEVRPHWQAKNASGITGIHLKFRTAESSSS